MYFETVIEREKLGESVEELKKRLRESIVCYEHVRDVAVALHKQGFALGIMSNHSTEWFDYIASTFKFAEFCPPHRTIVSQTVNAAKPSAAIMEKLYESFQQDFPAIKKEQVIFLDDTAANIKAAEDYGFKGIEYDARLQNAEELWTALSKYGIKRS